MKIVKYHVHNGHNMIEFDCLNRAKQYGTSVSKYGKTVFIDVRVIQFGQVERSTLFSINNAVFKVINTKHSSLVGVF